MEQKKVIVRFVRRHKGYNPNERASFDVAEAKHMIQDGGAILDDEEVTLESLGILKAEDDVAEVSTTTHELTVEQVDEHVQGIDSLDALQALWDGEQAHPNHEGGRKGALQAIQDRAEELKDELEKGE